MNLFDKFQLGLPYNDFLGRYATEDQKNGMASFVQQGPGKAVFVGR